MRLMNLKRDEKSRCRRVNPPRESLTTRFYNCCDPKRQMQKNLLELESLRARAADLNSNEDSSCPKVIKIVQWSTDVNGLQVTKITSNKVLESKGHFANHTSHML